MSGCNGLRYGVFVCVHGIIYNNNSHTRLIQIDGQRINAVTKARQQEIKKHTHTLAELKRNTQKRRRMWKNIISVKSLVKKGNCVITQSSPLLFFFLMNAVFLFFGIFFLYITASFLPLFLLCVFIFYHS